jgi:hypothetical protein
VSVPCRRGNHGGALSRRITCQSKNETKTPPTADASPLVKLAWYGSEAFGKVVAAFRPSSSSSEVEEEEAAYVGPVPRSEAVELIRKDYERSYFVTGEPRILVYSDYGDLRIFLQRGGYETCSREVVGTGSLQSSM